MTIRWHEEGAIMHGNEPEGTSVHKPRVTVDDLYEQRYGSGTTDDGVLRTFETGATRDTGQDKLDYEGFLSPIVLRRYAEYMHKNRKQSDGTLRSADNWQKGIPRDVYMSSMFRHFMDVWTSHRLGEEDIYLHEEQLCALLFNVMGYLFELMKDR